MIIHRKNLIGDYRVKEENRSNHIKTISKIIVIVFLVFVIVMVSARYLTDEDFRSYIDTKRSFRNYS